MTISHPPVLQYMTFVELDNTPGVTPYTLPQHDDDLSDLITIDGGFPFGNSTQDRVWVCEH